MARICGTNRIAGDAIDCDRRSMHRGPMICNRHAFNKFCALILAALIAVSAGAIAARAQDQDKQDQDKAEKPAEKSESPSGTALTLEKFLDRLMMAESGGQANARNPRSSAVGPYQFIASTWLMLTRAHFATETASLAPAQVLALRTDRGFARRAAEAYTHSNASYLAAQGLTPTFPHLRLAFLVGPGGAARILSAPSDARVAVLLGPTVIGANPFMANMTAEALIRRAARDIETDPKTTAGLQPDPARVAREMVASMAPAVLGAMIVPPVAREASELFRGIEGHMTTAAVAQAKPPPAAKPARPKIEVNCELSLPSCRRWLALAERHVSRGRRASN